ncbi:MAG: hypothetical protein HY763_04110 [Planctomycetes bacterium]|nr:hypothetical protein [Planctomycetota bacterium]
MDTNTIVLTGCGWVTAGAAGDIPTMLAAAGHVAPTGGPRYIPDRFRDELPGLSVEVKSDRGAWIAAIALEFACRSAALDLATAAAPRVGLVLGCALAGELGMLQFAEEVRQQSARFVSPIHFPQTVGNYIAGALARAYGICGPNTTLAGGARSGLEAMREAASLLARGCADVVIAGGVDCLTPELARGLEGSATIPREEACLFVMERQESAAARGAAPLAIWDETGGTSERSPHVVVSPATAWASLPTAAENLHGAQLAATGPAALARAIGTRGGGSASPA